MDTDNNLHRRHREAEKSISHIFGEQTVRDAKIWLRADQADMVDRRRQRPRDDPSQSWKSCLSKFFIRMLGKGHRKLHASSSCVEFFTERYLYV